MADRSGRIRPPFAATLHQVLEDQSSATQRRLEWKRIDLSLPLWTRFSPGPYTPSSLIATLMVHFCLSTRHGHALPLGLTSPAPLFLLRLLSLASACVQYPDKSPGTDPSSITNREWVSLVIEAFLSVGVDLELRKASYGARYLWRLEWPPRHNGISSILEKEFFFSFLIPISHFSAQRRLLDLRITLSALL